MSGASTVWMDARAATATLAAGDTRKDGIIAGPGTRLGDTKPMMKYITANTGQVEPTRPETPHIAHITALKNHSSRINSHFADSVIRFQLPPLTIGASTGERFLL